MLTLNFAYFSNLAVRSGCRNVDMYEKGETFSYRLYLM